MPPLDSARGGTVSISCTPGATVTITENNADGYFVTMQSDVAGSVPESTKHYELLMDDDHELDVTNTVGQTLPSTGGSITEHSIRSAALIVFCILLVTYCIIRKREADRT